MKRFIKRHPVWIVIIAAGLSAIVCSGLYAGWTTEKRRADQLLKVYAERISDKESERQRAWEANVGLMAANAFLLDSVRWESSVAGDKSGQAEVWKKKAMHAQRKWGDWKSRAQELEVKVCEQRRLIDMYRGAGWSAELPCEVEK